MSQQQENMSSSPDPIKVPVKYGELIVLGYNKTKSHFALCQRPEANGVKPSTVLIYCSPKAPETLKAFNTIYFTRSLTSMVVMEYAPDSDTDMFQIGRSKESPIDFVVTETVSDSQSVQDTLSRFACRIICQRSPPYAARIYAAGFDSSKNIFLGEKAVKWETPDGRMDGLTTNGVLVMQPLHGFTRNTMKPGLWREISVCGNVFTRRKTSWDQQQGEMVSEESESQELVDGSLIDLCGVTLLWRTAKGLVLMPTIDHLEVQRQELYAGRTCFVYKAAGILPDPQRDVCELTLDPDTAHRKLSLSENNRKVTHVKEDQKYPDNKDRFKKYKQVMCRESLTASCYWEVEWSGQVEIAVTYKGINRQGGDSEMGYNDKSWSLQCNGDNPHNVWHNMEFIELPVSPSSCSGRVAVYVDWPAGTVSFYTVSSDTLTHLHTFRSTCTEPLYAGFNVWGSDSSVSVCQREESQELVDGSLIDLCGVTLLWRTAKGLVLMPTIDHLEVQRQELYAGRTCFVYKAAGILPDPQRDVCELTLDPDTAHRKLSLSENNRKVTHVKEDQKYPDNKDRFKKYKQVMCRESLTASCYWEVEWSGQVEIAVTYKGINRQGGDSEMGYNDKSWSLQCNGDNPHNVWHNMEFIELPVSPSSCSGRVAVYVDWPAGTVSFYTVSSDTLTHLHTFRSTCTEPLYAGFNVWGSDSSVSVCQREESQELVDGSLIDLCGVTLLWRTAKGLVLMPTIDHLEVQRQELYAGRTCFVYKAAGILPDPQRDVCELTLDPDTAHRKLSLSENNRKVTHVKEDQKYPDNKDRFKKYKQVMCRESLTASCYWEVEWSGQVEIAVTYKGINRQGGDSEMGYNDKSWSLQCNGDNPHNVWHNMEFIELPVSPSSCSGRVAVYVDWPAGTVSFYTVSSDTLTHLHTFRSTCTEPLYAGFNVWGSDSSVSVCQREEAQ